MIRWLFLFAERRFLFKWHHMVQMGATRLERQRCQIKHCFFFISEGKYKHKWSIKIKRKNFLVAKDQVDQLWARRSTTEHRQKIERKLDGRKNECEFMRYAIATRLCALVASKMVKKCRTEKASTFVGKHGRCNGPMKFVQFPCKINKEFTLNKQQKRPQSRSIC